MKDALLYMLDALLQLVVWAFLVRLLMQLVRADFRNPFAGAIVTITNPVILPLRKLLPPVGRLDTASLVAVIGVQLAAQALILLAAAGAAAPFPLLLREALIALATNTTYVLSGAIFISVILSWVSQGGYHPLAAVFTSLSRPALRPFQKLIPPLGGLDLSPVFALIVLQALRILIARA
ncbi:MAG TPA: YggT family protein [Steroidobacteraceae bacterium]|nr:YggT family protein [Steroidobacteraceae bacterium]